MLIRPSTPRPAYGFEALLVIVQSKSVESIDAHDVQIRAVAGYIKAHDDDKISEDQDAALEIVALQHRVSSV